MKISIIIPTCHEKNLLPCLESIAKFTIWTDYEIIVVANGYDGTPPEGAIVFPDKIGYPRAVNEGIKASKGEFLILLNDDCEILGAEWMDMLQAPFGDPQMAITGPWMMYNTEIERDFLCFFCCMIKRSVLERIGFLDEGFGFGYGEDVDLCCKAVDAGFKIQQVPDQGKVPYDGRYGVYKFPIWHAGNKTFENWPGGEELLARNHARLRERYQGIDISNARKLGEWMGDEELRWLARKAKTSMVVIELGSWFGKSSTVLADHLPPDGVLYCVDTWAGSKVEQDTNHVCARDMDGDFVYDGFCRNLWRHIETGKLRPIRMHGAHAAKLFQDMGVKADLIFIDAGHTYEEVKEDILAYAPLMKKGGIISGHDYGRGSFGFEPWPSVSRAVNEVLGMNFAVNPETSIWSTDYNPSITVEERPRVWDGFLFFNEFELLDIRLHELADVVHKFVLVECAMTHQVKPKPFYFLENKERFKQFLPKIEHVLIHNLPDGFVSTYTGEGFPPAENWIWERYQRDKIMDGLKDARDDDAVIISDADEIPSAEAVRKYRTSMGLCYFDMELYYYYLNSDSGQKWQASKILPYSMLKEYGPCGARYSDLAFNNYGTKLENGGWHFSYCGGVDKVIEKIKSWGHAEYNRPDITDREKVIDRMERGVDILGRAEAQHGYHYKIVELNGHHPQYVQRNVQKFKELGFVK